MPPELWNEIGMAFEASGTLGVWFIIYLLWRMRQEVDLLKRIQRRQDRRIIRLEVHAGLEPLQPVND